MTLKRVWQGKLAARYQTLQDELQREASDGIASAGSQRLDAVGSILGLARMRHLMSGMEMNKRTGEVKLIESREVCEHDEPYRQRLLRHVIGFLEHAPTIIRANESGEAIGELDITVALYAVADALGTARGNDEHWERWIDRLRWRAEQQLERCIKEHGDLPIRITVHPE